MPNGVALTDRKNHRYDGKTEADRLAEGERMLLDRAHGMTQSAIMAKYGYSKVTVVARLQQALNARLATTVDAYREQQNAAIDHLMDRHADALEYANRLIAKALEDGNLAMAERGLDRLDKVTLTLLRLHERRAKLNGLDKPVEVEVTVNEVTEQDRELAEMIREAQARVHSTVQEHLGAEG